MDLVRLCTDICCKNANCAIYMYDIYRSVPIIGIASEVLDNVVMNALTKKAPGSLVSICRCIFEVLTIHKGNLTTMLTA